MDFVSIRVISADVAGLAAFYAKVLGTPAQFANPEFAEVRTARGAIAIGSPRTVAMIAPGAVEPGTNRSVIVEFLVDDVNAVFAGVRDTVEVVAEPTTMPWGNRSLLVRDPDGNLVNFFTPVSPEAKAKFGR
ncbi:VOC family protein [Actinoplanes rectilineatus]|uniref:VOC family protein n=1 Tax=Actinoplanes rectilineatus TaxID=113571 RepID=UPI0005F29E71|nr:VOC family protein [Actinoplanes rectilineatus]